MSDTSQHATHQLLRISCAMFFAYMTVGLPLAVIPLFVHQQLGLNDTLVGVSVGIQFLATVLTRSYAGRNADQRGARRTTFQGLFTCALAGILWLIVSFNQHSATPLTPFFLLLAGRLLLGLGESQLLTGNLTWGMGLAGAQRAGQVMSWNGMATYGALAVGAPVGAAIYQHFGVQVFSLVNIALPLIALAINVGVPVTPPSHGTRAPVRTVLGQIWRPGLALALQGIGFATISAFAALYFTVQHWGNAGFALSAFGGAFIVMRLLFGNYPDRYGGIRVATWSLLLECAGLLLLWWAPVYLAALAGAALTGAGCSLIYPSMGVEVVKRVSPAVRGTALGGYSAFQDIAYGITGPVAGMLASMTGYRGLFLAAAVCALAGAIFARWGVAQRDKPVNSERQTQ